VQSARMALRGRLSGPALRQPNAGNQSDSLTTVK
jgi:hypothetical protein